MSAGTLALTNGSTAVTGNGTAFTTDLAANDFIVCKIGGTTYTLGVATIGSATALTLTQPFSGPTTSGVAWYAVPNQSLVGITTELAANLTSVYRSVLVNDANWTKVFSQSGNITVTLKDGSTYTGPSWNSITTSLAAKMDKSQNLNDLVDKSTARTNLGWVNGYLPISLGGTGAGDKAGAWSAIATYGTTAGTAAQGNDTRLNTVASKTGGTITSAVTVSSGGIESSTSNIRSKTARNATSGALTQAGWFQSMFTGSNTTAQFASFLEEVVGQALYGVLTLGDGAQFKRWQFDISGNAYAINGTWTNGSDAQIKDGLEVIPDALNKLKTLTGYTGNRDGTRFTGLIAQDLEKVLPEAVSSMGRYTFQSDINGHKKGDTIPNALGVAYGDTVGLLVEAIKELSGIVDSQNTLITELQDRMKAIDGLDA